METRWKDVAGGNGQGDQLNQLNISSGMRFDRNKNLSITDYLNHRIMKWKEGEQEGTIVVGENREGNLTDQLYYPIDVIVDEQDNALITADIRNRRVVRWFNKNREEILVENIKCWGITMDKYRFLYVADSENNEVRRWKLGEKGEGTVVAGGNGRGNQLNQFTTLTSIFVDDEQSVYVSDTSNYRVMKWRKGAKEGVVVAGGNGKGNNLNQLNSPRGLYVDNDDGQIYVADRMNRRIMRWSGEKKEGEIIVDGNGPELWSNQLDMPTDLVFDVEGNLYVSDSEDRIQKFDLIL